ncbi:MAG: ribosomal-processing cysteine protease Prp [Eubacteriaceae bacterium]|nr:ribosomal-processing cysteine protease Prp [Eubacteriaceae bacterium]
MITAHFERADGVDRIMGATVSGHSGFDSYGNDIVCASVSALVLTAINALEEYVGIPCEVEIQEGYTAFRAEAIDEYTEIQAQTIMHALEIGLLGLGEEYEGIITVISS